MGGDVAVHVNMWKMDNAECKVCFRAAFYNVLMLLPIYTVPTPVTELHVHNKCTVEPRYSFSYMYKTNFAIVYVTGQIYF